MCLAAADSFLPEYELHIRLHATIISRTHHSATVASCDGLNSINR